MFKKMNFTYVFFSIIVCAPHGSPSKGGPFDFTLISHHFRRESSVKWNKIAFLENFNFKVCLTKFNNFQKRVFWLISPTIFIENAWKPIEKQRVPPCFFDPLNLTIQARGDPLIFRYFWMVCWRNHRQYKAKTWILKIQNRSQWGSATNLHLIPKHR